MGTNRAAILVEGGHCEMIKNIAGAHDNYDEVMINATPDDWALGNAQMWLGEEEGGKGVRLTFCLGEIPTEQLLQAAFDDTVWLHLHLTDAVDKALEDTDSWLPTDYENLAAQFEGFAAKLKAKATAIRATWEDTDDE